MNKSSSPEEIVADLFDGIILRCDDSGRPSGLSRVEQMLWYVVSTRCEIDMEGFDSVFDQMLTESELQFLIEALTELEELELASAFQRAYDALKSGGFYGTPQKMCQDLGAAARPELRNVSTLLESSQRLWELDAKLAALLA